MRFCKIIFTVLSIYIITVFFGCSNQGSKYVGDWESTTRNEIINIKKNGNMYLVSQKIEHDSNEFPATIKDGILTIDAGVAKMTLFLDEKTGLLVSSTSTPIGMQQDKYVRYKEGHLVVHTPTAGEFVYVKIPKEPKEISKGRWQIASNKYCDITLVLAGGPGEFWIILKDVSLDPNIVIKEVGKFFVAELDISESDACKLKTVIMEPTGILVSGSEKFTFCK